MTRAGFQIAIKSPRGLSSRRFGIWVLCLLGSLGLQAQFATERASEWEILRPDGSAYSDPWLGGLNFTQFSDWDYNGNGLQDLLIFEESGERILLLEASAVADSVHFKWNPEATAHFPAATSFALIRDFDQDGWPDLFSYLGNGMIAWRNTEGETGMPGFEAYDNSKVLPTIRDGVRGNLNFPGSDIPGLADIDLDGDLDVLIFDADGAYMEWHSNQSLELYGHRDSLIFERLSTCWGEFRENDGDNGVTLDTCNNPLLPDWVERGPHQGSTICVTDLQEDGDFDLLLGDLSFPWLTELLNGGVPGADFIVNAEAIWPADDVPAIIQEFPAAFAVDADSDGDQDIIAAPSARNLSENRSGILYYENVDPAAALFRQREVGFLQSETFDLGEGCYPTTVDVDQDGLLDLLVGNHHLDSGSEEVPRLAWLRNMGAMAGQARFELMTEDLLDFASLGISDPHIAPTTGDLDGDGDEDLVIGNRDGELYYFRNEAGAGNPVDWQLQNLNAWSIDVGAFAAPALFDLDEDGDLDLIVGERNGNLNYYRNEGDPDAAGNWTLVTELLGGVNVAGGDLGVGFSMPYLWRANGRSFLLVGTLEGHCQFYRDLQIDPLGTYPLGLEAFADYDDGERAAPVFADFDGDGLRDFVVGNYAGGLQAFRGLITTSVSEYGMTLTPCSISATAGQSLKLPTHLTGEALTLNSITGASLALQRGPVIGLPDQVGIYFLNGPSGGCLLMLSAAP